MSDRATPRLHTERRDRRGRVAGVIVGAALTSLCLIVAAYFLLLAFMITPDGFWDHESVSRARIAAGVSIVFAGLGALLVRAFNKARWLRTWWYALPVVLVAGSIWRMVFPGQA
ncbi:hypothetical protein [Streptomyces sp. TR06-5]|uniref:hypothetical protein n=1 Tax=unclassified Streptomyces TaxID=2593676 RepID=UPI0039A3221B